MMKTITTTLDRFSSEVTINALAILLARYAGHEDAARVRAQLMNDDGSKHTLPSQSEPVTVKLAVGEVVGEHTLTIALTSDATQLVFDAERFDSDTIARITEHFAAVLAGKSGELISADERARILALSNASNVLFDEPLPNIVEMFEAHARQTPDAPAVIDESRSLTYRELDDAANALAARLFDVTSNAISTAANPHVATYLNRGVDAVIAFLGILKAGGTYIPIDTGYPEARVAAILEGAAPIAIVSHSSIADRIPATAAPQLLIDEAADEVVALEQQQQVLTGDTCAYVIFTSGSTGKPKGVAVDHRSLASYARAAVDAYHVDSQDRVMQAASLGFDLSLEEIVITLTAGAALVVRSLAPIESIQSFFEECVARQLTILSITSALWHELTMRLDDRSVALPPLLRLVILGADVARPDVLSVWQRATEGSGVRLVNSYGLTETTIVATVWEAPTKCSTQSLDASWRALPIGRPLRNASAYVLNERNELQPIGIAGEICIGGLAVATRYVGDDELTNARFVPDPFLPGRRMYRTGDRGILRASGDFEFLGRADYQIKVNGVRIELGEIEARLREYPGVIEGIVIAGKNPAGETELTAHVMTAEKDRSCAQSSAIKEYLATVIPAAAVPSRIRVVDRFPLTPAGKIDRRALAENDAKSKRGVERRHDAPANPIETLVATVVAKVLNINVTDLGMLDEFSQLGGTSLSAVRAASILGDQLHRRVRAQVFLESKTLREMSEGLASTAHSQQAMQASVTISIKEDTILSASIVPLAPRSSWFSPAPPSSTSRVETVFLTGATGFYGTFVLDDLLRQTNAKVICLVRAPSPEVGRARILATLERRRCTVEDHEAFNARVTVVSGDIGQPNLGLTEEVFDHLAETVTTIFHIGANVNMMLPYDALRASNVSAVESVLRLATTKRAKTVHHVSTVEVLSDMDRSDPRALAERRTASSAALLHDGYGQSKWVAEKLIEGARRRGIRAYIHRPGRLLGHSQTGAFNADDFLVRMLESCGSIGAAPVLDVDVDMTPVDYASRALVLLGESTPEQLDQIEAFHLVHPETITWISLVEQITNLGYPLRLVSHDEWRALLESSTGCSNFGLYLAGMSKSGMEAAIHGGYASSETQAALTTRRSPGIVDALEVESHSHLIATYLETLADAGRFPQRVPPAE